MFLKGQNDEGIMKDDQGVVVGKMKDKASFKDWIEKIFTDPSAHSSKKNSRFSPTSSINLDTRNSQNQWETHVGEIESYFQLLASSDLDEDNNHDQDSNSPTESDMPEEYTDSNLVILKYPLFFLFFFFAICGYNCNYFYLFFKKKFLS